jgi:glucose/mannose transport system substrate-binding protein
MSGRYAGTLLARVTIGLLTVASLPAGCGTSYLGDLEGTSGTSCALLAEGSPAPDDLAAGDDDLNFVTFWSQDGEKAALTLLQSAFSAEACPQLERNRCNLNYIYFKDREDKNNLGDPTTDVVQQNGGVDVRKLVKPSDPKGVPICPLEFVAKDNFFDETIQPSSCDGKLYALPIGVHQVNYMYANKDLLEFVEGKLSKNIEEQTTAAVFAAFLEDSRKVLAQAFGESAPVPIAIAVTDSDGPQSWPFELLIFDNLMASFPKLYDAVWRGIEYADFGVERNNWWEAVRRVVDQSQLKLGPESELTWTAALQKVADGSALFTVMGNWATAEFRPEQWSEVVPLPFPPTSSRFVYTPDSIVVPRTPDDAGGAAARVFLENLQDTQVLVDFAVAKSAVPPQPGLEERFKQALAEPKFLVDRWKTEELEISEDQKMAWHALTDVPQSDIYERFQTCSSSDCLLAVSGFGSNDDPCFDEVGTFLLDAVRDDTSKVGANSSGASGGQMGCESDIGADQGKLKSEVGLARLWDFHNNLPKVCN